MRVRDPVDRVVLSEWSARPGREPLSARSTRPGIASNGVPCCTAAASSTIVSSPSPITQTSTSGVESSVNPAVAVMCSPPATIGTPGKRRRTIWIRRRISGQSCENMQLMPIRSDGSIRSTISSLRRPMAMTRSSNSRVTWDGFSPRPSTIRAT